MIEKLNNKVKVGGRYLTSKLRLSKSLAPAAGAPAAVADDAGCYNLLDESLLSDEALQNLSCDGAMLLSTSNMSGAKACCLFAALSFHSMMEGIGLGTQQKKSMLASISVAILAHKGLAAFALGTAFCKSKLSRTQVLVMALVFSSGTPCGIAIGALVSQHFNGPATSVCTAFAAGTFLQVSMMEIIPSVLVPISQDTPCLRVLRVMCIALGYTMMCFTIYICG